MDVVMGIFTVVAVIALYACGVALSSLLYCLPIIIANRRNIDRHRYVAVITLTLGWTVLGWIYALVVSLNDGKNSCRGDELPSLHPGLYTILFFIPGISTVSLSLFAYDAWRSFTFIKRNRSKALKSIIWLNTPIIGAVYAFVCIYPLGRILKAQLDQLSIRDIEFGDAFSRVSSFFVQPYLALVAFSFVVWGTQVPRGGSSALSFAPMAIVLIAVTLAVVFGIISTICMYYNYTSAIRKIRDAINAQPAPSPYSSPAAGSESGEA